MVMREHSINGLLIFHSYCCLLLGAHVLIVMGALQIYIDDDDDVPFKDCTT